MAALLLLVLQSAPVLYGEHFLEQYNTYTIQQCDVQVTPQPTGARIRCDLRVKVRFPGPLHFVLTKNVLSLAVSRDGQRLPHTLGGGSLGTVVGLVAPKATGVPTLVAVRPKAKVGDVLTLRFEYLWRPGEGGMAYAGGGRLDSHLTSFWLPSMAHQHFKGSIEVTTPGYAVGAGKMSIIKNGWRFDTTEPMQVLAFVVGKFDVHERGDLALYVPPGVNVDPDAMFDDVTQVLNDLEGRFGPRPEKSFRVVIDPAPRPSPSYCGGNFVVLHRTSLPSAIDRTRWLAHLAHECSHRWWGHHVSMPLVGHGGTWLREGLAQWSGIRVTGALAGESEERRLWQAHVGAYLGTCDLRRLNGGLYANEPTLRNATPIDTPRVAYWRGALVLRLLRHVAGAERFDAFLREVNTADGKRELTLEKLGEGLGTPEVVAYYALTSRVPDFALEEVAATGSATIRCLDPEWPGGTVPCRVKTSDGEQNIDVVIEDGAGVLRWTGRATRIEVDPDRLWLDPIRSNSSWGVAKK